MSPRVGPSSVRWVVVGTLLGSILGLVTSCKDPAFYLHLEDSRNRENFSRDGRLLFVWYELPTENLRAYQVGTWKEVLSYPLTNGKFNFTCADPDIVVTTESVEYASWRLLFLSISSGKTILSYKITTNTLLEDFYCDPDENTVYLHVFENYVTAFNGSTGERIRDYQAPDPQFSKFFVQKNADRLLRLDPTNHGLFLFRLSTGEQIGTLILYPEPPDGWSVNSILTFPDDDHLVYVPVEKNTAIGSDEVRSHLILEDLVGMKLVHDAAFDGSEITTVQSIAGRADQVLGYEERSGSLWSVKPDTGEVTAQLALDFYCLDNTVLAIPDASEILIGQLDRDSSVSEFSLSRYWVYRLPELDLVHEGYDVLGGQKQWVQDGQLVLATWGQRLSVFNLPRYKLVEEFFTCSNSNIKYSSNYSGWPELMDPKGRYAGIDCDEGLLLVDLDAFR